MTLFKKSASGLKWQIISISSLGVANFLFIFLCQGLLIEKASAPLL